jgi:hypothetical protein
MRACALFMESSLFVENGCQVTKFAQEDVSKQKSTELYIIANKESIVNLWLAGATNMCHNGSC